MDYVELVCAERPPSGNNSTGKRRGRFKESVAAALARVGSPFRIDGLLYGVVVVFATRYQPPDDPDADNLSKKVWDFLQDLGAFANDKNVRLRTAMVVDLGARDATLLDLSSLPPSVQAAVGNMIEAPRLPPRWLTFIRYGALEPAMMAGALARGRE